MCVCDGAREHKSARAHNHLLFFFFLFNSPKFRFFSPPCSVLLRPLVVEDCNDMLKESSFSKWGPSWWSVWIDICTVSTLFHFSQMNTIYFTMTLSHCIKHMQSSPFGGPRTKVYCSASVDHILLLISVSSKFPYLIPKNSPGVLGRTHLAPGFQSVSLNLVI